MVLKCDCSQEADTSELGEEFTETINTCTDRCRTKLFALQAEAVCAPHSHASARKKGWCG